jgi:hypothetical protein
MTTHLPVDGDDYLKLVDELSGTIAAHAVGMSNATLVAALAGVVARTIVLSVAKDTDKARTELLDVFIDIVKNDLMPKNLDAMRAKRGGSA